MNNNNFYNPTKIIFGPGSLQKLKKEADSCFKRGALLIVTGKNSMRKSGYLAKIVKALHGKEIIVFEGIKANPEVSDIDKLLKYAKISRVKNVLALGGGSVLDAAKVISLLVDKKYTLNKVLKQKIVIKKRLAPIIAIPTTAGTGSEVTKTAVVWRKKKAQKLSVMSESLFPDVAIIDPLITKSLSRYHTATTGLDALSHAIESYWSKKSNKVTRKYAINSVKLIFSNLVKAYRNPNNLNARSKMSLASLYAGLAISNTGTTAAHSASYALTSVHSMPHGLACALFLPKLIEHNYKKAPMLTSSLAKRAGFNNPKDMIQKVDKLLKDLGLARNLSSYKVKRKDIGLIVRVGFKTKNIENSISKITKKELKEILDSML